MNARAAILSAVRAVTIPSSPLPDVANTIATVSRSNEHLIALMVQAARAGASHVVVTSRGELNDVVANAAPNVTRVLSMVRKSLAPST